VIVLLEIFDYITLRILAIDILGSFRTKTISLCLNRSEYLSGRLGRNLEVLLSRNKLFVIISLIVDFGILSSFAIYAGFLFSSIFLMIFPLIYKERSL
jgi:hypothetical protein